MLLELELPRVLAPDLSSNCYSVGDLTRPHFNYRTYRPSIAMFCHVFRGYPMENVARLLPSLEVVAVFKATSPGSNPDPLYPLSPRQALTLPAS